MITGALIIMYLKVFLFNFLVMNRVSMFNLLTALQYSRFLFQSSVSYNYILLKRDLSDERRIQISGCGEN